MTFAIRAEGIGKLYKINQNASRATSLREELSARLTGIFGRNSASPANIDLGGVGSYWALQDVSFEVAKGERVGIIGANGAGKSTLLKILSRVTAPSCGRIELRGKVASLLEVGTGFHPELSGRENVYLSGAILGMPREEIRRKFDQIVEFSGVQKFIDTPVKHYSSGMYVRLAFSVSAWLDPDILILDEVLAVGDQGFQKKCEERMRELTREGRTVLFVSHSMATINQMCQKALYLERGRVVSYGPVVDMTRNYHREVMRQIEQEQAEKFEREHGDNSPAHQGASEDNAVVVVGASEVQSWRWHRVSFTLPNPRIEVVSDHPGVITCLRGDAMSPEGQILEVMPIERETHLRVRFRLNETRPRPLVPTFNIYDELGALLCVALPEQTIPGNPGTYDITLVLPPYFLNNGRYTIDANLSDFEDSKTTYCAIISAFRLEIEEDTARDPRRHGFKPPLPGGLRTRLDIRVAESIGP